jgi:peptidoglycan-associated lipoprotein
MKKTHVALALVALTFPASCKKQKAPEATAEQEMALELPVSDSVETPVEVAPPEHVQEMVRSLSRTFFELDSADLTADAKSVLNENAGVLREHGDVKLEIQGHADERGTTEYNLALGQKRAQAVYDFLVNAGIGTSRLAVISYGEESPLTAESSEQAWSENRRAEFRITWGKGGVEGTVD